MKLYFKVLAALALCVGLSAFAQAPMSLGEIVKVDKENSKLTIRHGPLENLQMPGMTMVFKAKDLAMMEQVAEGDKVKFVAEKVNGALVITALEKTAD